MFACASMSMTDPQKCMNYGRVLEMSLHVPAIYPEGTTKVDL